MSCTNVQFNWLSNAHMQIDVDINDIDVKFDISFSCEYRKIDIGTIFDIDIKVTQQQCPITYKIWYFTIMKWVQMKDDF